MNSIIKYTANGYLPCGGRVPTPLDCNYPPYEARVIEEQMTISLLLFRKYHIQYVNKFVVILREVDKYCLADFFRNGGGTSLKYAKNIYNINK